jgi:hypothetical protein
MMLIHYLKKIADEQRKNAAKKEGELLAKFEVRTADTKFLIEATEQLIAVIYFLLFCCVKFSCFLSNTHYRIDECYNILMYMVITLTRNHKSAISLSISKKTWKNTPTISRKCFVESL